MKKNNKNNNESTRNNNDRRNEKRKRGIRGRGGRGGRSYRGGGFNSKKLTKVLPSVQPHRLEGLYIIKTDKDYIATKNLSIGGSYYGEELISIEEIKEENSESEIIPEDINKNKVEYRIWDPFYSKLGASIENGINYIFMKPSSKVLYLGAGSDSYSTITHISDLVGEEGTVYGVEISEIKGLDLKNIAKKRENIIPIINDARKPFNYKTVIQSLVDYIFTDISSPEISNIISMNAGFFLKNKGGFICIIKEEICNFDEHIKLLREYNLFAKEFITLEPFKTGFAIVDGIYKPYREIIDEE